MQYKNKFLLAKSYSNLILFLKKNFLEFRLLLIQKRNKLLEDYKTKLEEREEIKRKILGVEILIRELEIFYFSLLMIQ